jgi:hydroxyacylglutathione hydrolase
MANIIPIPALKDNYIWLIQETDTVAIVDPGEAGPVLQVLHDQRLHPSAILVTHHHWDHVNGIQELLKHYPVPVYGPATESIPGRIKGLREGDRVHLPGLGIHFQVFDVPGHTLGAIAYYGEGLLFSGDTLFTAGCGRLFEGTPAQMYESLSKLASLDETTQLYCGHEYTLANAHFALTVEPGNQALRRRADEVAELRAKSLPTLPTTIAAERAANPFLRPESPEIRKNLAMPDAPNAKIFAELRERKNRA